MVMQNLALTRLSRAAFTPLPGSYEYVGVRVCRANGRVE